MANHKPKKSDRHGHIVPNPSLPRGVVCDCGGPFTCADCRKEIIAHIGPTRGGWYAEARDMNALEDRPHEVTLWALRTAELAQELARVSAALRDVLACTGRYQPGEGEKARARLHAERILVEVEVERE